MKLPGASPTAPNRYTFGTPYAAILADLRSKDERYYTSNGLIPMMERNAAVKAAPQRFQARPPEAPPLDVVVCFESKVADIVVADLRRREAVGNGASHPCLVINLEVRDSTAEAASAAPAALLLCRLLDEAGDWTRKAAVEGVLERFVAATGRRRPTYTVCFV